MPQSNANDLIRLLLEAGISPSALMRCGLMVVDGLLVASVKYRDSLDQCSKELAEMGVSVLLYDAGPELPYLEEGQKESATDTAIEALANPADPSLEGLPFHVGGYFMIVVCGEELKGKVLASVPGAMVAAGFPDLPLLLVDVEGTRSIIHCASMAGSIQPEPAITDESLDELSRLLSSTGSVEEFLNALK